MKRTPSETRQMRRRNFEGRKVPKFTVEDSGASFDCYLLPPEECLDEIPNAILSYVPTFFEYWADPALAKEVFFAIDSRIPDKFRRYVVLHDFWEAFTLGPSDALCAEATKREIAAVKADQTINPDELKKYYRLRREYYSQMAAFAKREKGVYSPVEIEGFTASWSLFEKELG